jgi:hypothetical protein
MAKTAAPELRQELEERLGPARRSEEASGIPSRAKKCAAMDGWFEEGEERMEATPDAALRHFLPGISGKSIPSGAGDLPPAQLVRIVGTRLAKTSSVAISPTPLRDPPVQTSPPLADVEILENNGRLWIQLAWNTAERWQQWLRRHHIESTLCLDPVNHEAHLEPAAELTADQLRKLLAELSTAPS